jgi:hypothetical protein
LPREIIFGFRGCVKRFLPPAAAKFYIETELDSLILLRKINESSSVSNYYLARSAEKILFTQAHIILRDASFFEISLREISKNEASLK